MIRDSRRAPDRIPTEVILDRVQVIWLTLGGLVVIGLSFALGLVAGRRAERLERTDVAAETSDPLEAIETESQQLAFYRELKDEPPLAPMPKPVPKPVVNAKAPAPKVGQAPAVAAEAEQRIAAAEKSKPRPRPRPKRAPRPKPSGGDVKTKLQDGPAIEGQYTVQVSAFQSMDEAQAFAASLERKGYAPFITTASLPQKGTWFRVRMGAFDNELEATLAKQILAQRDIPAWVLRTD